MPKFTESTPYRQLINQACALMGLSASDAETIYRFAPKSGQRRRRAMAIYTSLIGSYRNV